MADAPLLSIAVMAHRKREKFFPYLRGHLGNVPFLIDDEEQNLGTWKNCKRAWQAIDRKAKYGLVIQDDSLLCLDFVKTFQRFLEKNPGDSFQLFFGERGKSKPKPDYDLAREQGYFKAEMMWGVAICLKTELIDEMIEFCDQFDSRMPDDSRIKRFCIHKEIETIYPFPSLVDHRIGESLVQKKKDPYRIAVDFKERKYLPQKIHQIWIGKNPMPKQYIKSWQNIEGWEHMLWRDEDLAKLPMKNRKLYDYFYRKQCWYGAADVARLEILEQYGGVYIDADTLRKKPWENQSFFFSEFFACQANTAPSNEYRIANGIIGCQPSHPIIREYIERMGKAKKIEPLWNTIGGSMLTEIVLANENRYPNIQILEPYHFFPINSRGIRSPNAHRCLAVHYWGSTKRSYR